LLRPVTTIVAGFGAEQHSSSSRERIERSHVRNRHEQQMAPAELRAKNTVF
jgi:hypothetical protein